MSAPSRQKRFAPPRGENVPWHRTWMGDWAYVSGYWWKVAGYEHIHSGDQIMVALERPGMTTEAPVVSVQRWRLAAENRP